MNPIALQLSKGGPYAPTSWGVFGPGWLWVTPVGVEPSGAFGVVIGEGAVTATGHTTPKAFAIIEGDGSVGAVGLAPGAIPQASGVVSGEGTLTATGSTTPEASGTVEGEGTIIAVGSRGAEPEPAISRSTGLRFEAWTLPSTGIFEKRFDLPDVLAGASGTVELSTYSDGSFHVPATFPKLDQLVSTTTGSLIKVFHRAQLIDEFEAARVSIPAGRPNIREISGPQRNGLLEGIGIAPKNYPNHDPGAMHWKWGARNILPELKLEKLGSIQEEWEVWHDHTAGSWNAAVDGDSNPIAFNASANDVEGTATTGVGLQGLSTVNDVTVSGSGSEDDPYVITFVDPPDPGTVGFTQSTLSGGTTFSATLIKPGALDPSPITKSKPVDAGTAPDEDHGAYGNPEIEVAFTPLDTGAEWTLRVNAEARYAGTQIKLTGLTPGQTYSNISVPVRPTIAGTYVLLIKDLFENRLAQTSPRDVPLSAGSYQTLTIPTFTATTDQVVVRVAVTDDNPANIGTFYVSWQTATFLEGEPEASFTKITRELLQAAQDRGVGTWVELDATDNADTLGTALEDLSYTVFVGDNVNLVNSHLDQGSKDGYQWDLRPAVDAQVITPAGTTTHVLQIFYVAAGEIEDLTADAGGPSVLTGAHVSEAQLVTRRQPYTTLIGLGTEAVSAEDTDAAAEAAIGRVERIVDVEHLGTPASIQAHLDAQFAEQVLNQKALSATVLGSATQLPGVDYGAGSKIWWQFPGIHAKEARPVKRWSWTHGNLATFQVQGSRVLTKEGAMAAAVDMFLRRPDRRRDHKRPVSATREAGSGGAMTVQVASSTASVVSKSKADIRCDGNDDQEAIQAATGLLPPEGGRVWLSEGAFSISAPVALPPRVHLMGMGRFATRLVRAGAATQLLDVDDECTISDLRLVGGTLVAISSTLDAHRVEIRDVVFDTAGICVRIKGDQWKIHGNLAQGLAFFPDYFVRDQDTYFGAHIVGNVVRGGIDLGDGVNWLVGNNTLWEEVIANGGEFGTITGNHWRNESGTIETTGKIDIANHSDITIVGNTIPRSSVAGIILHTCTSGAITGNTVKDAERGVYLVDCSYVTVSGNLAQWCFDANYEISGGGDNTLVGNTAVASDGDNYLVAGDDNLVKGNKSVPTAGFSTAVHGINIASGSNNAVYANYLGQTAAYGTGDFNDSGTGTITAPGANGQFAY